MVKSVETRDSRLDESADDRIPRSRYLYLVSSDFPFDGNHGNSRILALRISFLNGCKGGVSRLFITYHTIRYFTGYIYAWSPQKSVASVQTVIVCLPAMTLRWVYILERHAPYTADVPPSPHIVPSSPAERTPQASNRTSIRRT